MATMVNPLNQIALNPNAKDSRWLTLEVCREYQRNKCTRTENECKFAHPPPHVEVQNGRVIACFDSIKGKCQRKDPPCKYLHPPQHLREQLLQNGRNNLILKSLHLQAIQGGQIIPIQMQGASTVKSLPPAAPTAKPMAYPTTVLQGQIPYLAAAASQSRHVSPASFVSFASSSATARAPHFLTTVPSSVVPQFQTHYTYPTIAMQGGADGTIVTQQLSGVIPTAMPNKAPQRPDRLEVCREFQRGTCTRQPSDCRYAHPTENVTLDSGESQVTVCMDFVKNKCTRDSCRYFHPPAHLQSQIKSAQQRANASSTPANGPTPGVPMGLVPPYKRLAVDGSGLGKSGIPMYQPTLQTSPYHQAALMQLQQQPYIPVSCGASGFNFIQLDSGEVMSAAYANYLPQVTGHPPAMPRF